MVGTEPSPQSSETVLVSIPPGLSIVPLTLTVPPSTMLDDDNTRPGAAKSRRRVADGDSRLREGGLAVGVAQGHADRVRAGGRVGRVVVRGGKGVGPGREVDDGRRRTHRPS